MFVVTVLFQIKPEKMNDFLPLMIANAKASLDLEAGCKVFDVCSDKENEIFLYEVYDNAAAFDEHLQSDHFKTFSEAVDGMIADKSVKTYSKVAL